VFGFRVRIKDFPEQPGERRVSIHWFFLLLGLVLVGVGLIGLRDYFLKRGPVFSAYWGSFCAFFGVWELLGFAISEKLIREGRPPKALFTIRVRQLILFGSFAGYMALWFLIIQLLPKQLSWTFPLIWVIGGGLLGTGIVRYFRRHPPQH